MNRPAFLTRMSSLSNARNTWRSNVEPNRNRYFSPLLTMAGMTFSVRDVSMRSLSPCAVVTQDQHNSLRSRLVRNDVRFDEATLHLRHNSRSPIIPKCYSRKHTIFDASSISRHQCCLDGDTFCLEDMDFRSPGSSALEVLLTCSG